MHHYICVGVSGSVGAGFPASGAFILDFANLFADRFSIAISNYESSKAEQDFLQSVIKAKARPIEDIPDGEVIGCSIKGQVAMNTLEPEVIAFLEEGRKIEAIKKLRELRRIGLKEAKDIVDDYCSGHDTQHSSVQKVASGNGLVLILVLGIVGYLIYLYIQ